MNNKKEASEELEHILEECDMLPNGKWVSLIADSIYTYPESMDENGNPLFLISGTIGVYIISETTSSQVFRWDFNANLKMTCFDAYEVGFRSDQLEEYLRLHINLAHSYMTDKNTVETMEPSISGCSKRFVNDLNGCMIRMIHET